MSDGAKLDLICATASHHCISAIKVARAFRLMARGLRESAVAAERFAHAEIDVPIEHKNAALRLWLRVADALDDARKAIGEAAMPDSACGCDLCTMTRDPKILEVMRKELGILETEIDLQPKEKQQ